MIWDFVMAGYAADVDMLVCRMTQLDSVVDRLVVVDSPLTFGGRSKPSHVQDNLERLLPWRDKITWIHGSNDPQPGQPHRQHEYDARELAQGELYRAALADADPDDVVLVGAADEIPRVQEFRPGTVLAMRQHIYDLRTVCREWHRPSNTSVFRAGDLAGDRPVMEWVYDSRYNAEEIPDAGWHLTYFGGPQAIREKLLAVVPDRETDGWLWDYRPLHAYTGTDYPAWVQAGDCPQVWWDACPHGLVRGSDSG